MYCVSISTLSMKSVLQKPRNTDMYNSSKMTDNLYIFREDLLFANIFVEIKVSVFRGFCQNPN